MSGKPKAETRIPKEARSPRSEWPLAWVALLEGSDFWTWGHEASTPALVLKDEAPAPLPQRDLLERTALFAEAIVRFAKKVPQGPVTNRLISQVVGAGSSVAANYCEADDSVSGKDYRKSIGTCRKESKETMLFLRLIAVACDQLAPEARKLWREAKELNLIFGSIWRK